MKKTLLLLIILFFSLTSILSGQVQSGIQANYGYSTGYFKDYNYSALHYLEKGHQINLEYIRRKEASKNLWRINFNPKLHALHHTEYDFLKSTLLGGNIGFSYLRQIVQSSSNFELFAGIGYDLDVNFIDFLGLESYSWLFRHGLDLNTSMSYYLNEKHQFRGNITLPIFHILNRPPYNGVDKYVLEKFENNLPAFAITGDFQSWNKYGFAKLKIEYLYQFSNKWQLVLGYNLAYREVYDETNYTQLNNQFHVGINLSL